MTDRESFEAWAVSKGISIERDGFGGYESHWTDGALEGWQAALRSQQTAANPAPDHTALLRQALDALRLPCDRWNKQQTRIINDTIAAIEGALK